MATKLYQLEQGVKNPRDGEVTWMPFDAAYATLAEAKREAKEHLGLWRIVEMKVVWQSEPA